MGTAAKWKKGGLNMKKSKKTDIAKTQTGLRLPNEIYDEIVKEAAEYGMTINSYMTFLIGLGRKVVLQSVAQCSRERSHNLQDNAG